MPIMDMLPKGDTLQIPLDAPTSFSATAGNAQVELTWADPANKYATPEGEVSETGDQLVSEWSHTVVVRKTGNQPAGPDDGTVVVSSSVRDQYKTSAYVDSNLTNDTLYYYGVFSYNKDGVASEGAFVTATPKAGTPLSELAEGTLIKINENGSPVEFYLAKHNYEPRLNGEGRELVVRKDVVQKGKWNSAGVNSYANSTIDTWFNGTYKGYFSTAVQALMGSTTFYYTPGNGNWTMGTLGRSIFALSVRELGATGDRVNAEGTTLPNSITLRIAYLDGSATAQWTRTPSWTSGTTTSGVSDEYGGIYNLNCANSYGYRPCFTLPSTALVTEELELVEG